MREGEEAVVAEEDGDLHAKICLELERAEDEATRDAVLREVEAVEARWFQRQNSRRRRGAHAVRSRFGVTKLKKRRILVRVGRKDYAAPVLLYQKKKQKTTAPIFKKSKKTTNKDASSQPQQSAPSPCAPTEVAREASRRDRCGALRMRNSDKST